MTIICRLFAVLIFTASLFTALAPANGDDMKANDTISERTKTFLVAFTEAALSKKFDEDYNNHIYFLFFKPEIQTVTETVTPEQLYEEFSTNASAAKEKYADLIFDIKGKVDEAGITESVDADKATCITFVNSKKETYPVMGFIAADYHNQTPIAQKGEMATLRCSRVIDEKELMKIDMFCEEIPSIEDQQKGPKERAEKVVDLFLQAKVIRNYIEAPDFGRVSDTLFRLMYSADKYGLDDACLSVETIRSCQLFDKIPEDLSDSPDYIKAYNDASEKYSLSPLDASD